MKNVWGGAGRIGGAIVIAIILGSALALLGLAALVIALLGWWTGVLVALAFAGGYFAGYYVGSADSL